MLVRVQSRAQINFMKKLLFISLFSAVTFWACENDKKAEKAEKAEIIEETTEDVLPLKEEIIHSDGIKLYTAVYGKGKPLIFLSSPGYLSSRFYITYVQSIFPDYQIITMDYRGTGKSDFPKDSVFSLEKYAADVELLINKYVKDSCIIFAHGFGALPSIMTASVSPEKISHLIFSNPFPLTSISYNNRMQEMISKRSEEMTGELFNLYKSKEFKQGDSAAVMKVFSLEMSQLIDPLAKDYLLKDIRLNAQELKNLEFIKSMNEKALLKYDLTSQAEKIAEPILMFRGDLDFLSLPTAEEYQAACKNILVHNVPGSVHFTYIENPDFVKREIQKFLSEN